MPEKFDRATPLTQYIVEQVRRLRRERGMSAAQLAAAVAARGVPCRRGTIATLEIGRREHIRVDELLAFAAALEVPVSLLIPAEHTVKPSADEQFAAVIRTLSDLRRDLREGGGR